MPATNTSGARSSGLRPKVLHAQSDVTTKASVTPIKPKGKESAAGEFCSPAAAAKRWNVSTDTIRRLLASGQMTGYRLNNRIIRLDLAEVDACFKAIPTSKAS